MVNKFEFGAWVLPDLLLPPGRGALLFNPGEPFEVTFSGEPSPDPVPPFRGAWNLVAVSESDLAALKPADGQVVIRVFAHGSFSEHHYRGSWIPEIELAPMEAFFLSSLDGDDAGCPGADDSVPVYDLQHCD